VSARWTQATCGLLFLGRVLFCAWHWSARLSRVAGLCEILLLYLLNSAQKEMFTRVLKGHIALDVQSFPPGTPGCLLDTLARQHLWAAGKNCLHGTRVCTVDDLHSFGAVLTFMHFYS
jgi:hypothetical protein